MARKGCSPEHPRYLRGCKRCQDAAQAEKDSLARRRAAGQSLPAVPVEEVRAHCRKLRGAGWSVFDIARESGLSRGTIEEMFRTPPRRKTVQGDNAKRVLDLKVQPLVEIKREGCVPALVSTRMLQALNAMGHSLHIVGAEIGLSGYQVRVIGRGDLTYVMEETAAKIDKVYSAWCTVPGEKTSGDCAPTTRATAKKKGYHDPLAWDDIRDPRCEPELYEEVKRDRDDVDEGLVRHALDGYAEWRDLTHAEKTIVIRELRRRMPDSGIAEMLHVGPDTIAQHCRRENIPAAPPLVQAEWLERQRQHRDYLAPAGTRLVRRRWDSIPGTAAQREARIAQAKRRGHGDNWRGAGGIRYGSPAA